jgi:hypothetical protein
MSERKKSVHVGEGPPGSWDLTMMMRRSQAESRFTGAGYFFLTSSRRGVPENP